jgi:D-psicose/D-tagatose/L-ribulose 3-epimerase
VSLRYAVHAYAWTSSWSNDDLWIFDHAKELGLDAVEIPLMEPDKIDPVAIRERAQACGLTVLSSLALPEGADPADEKPEGRRSALSLLLRCVDLAAEMGADILTGVVYSSIGARIERRPQETDFLRAAEVLREVARYALGRRVAIGLEPVNRYETFLINTAAQALHLRELIGEANVGIHLDSYHMNIEEDDFFAATLAAVPWLVHVHLSESHRGIPGQGTVNWGEIMGALAAGGYSGYVGLESFAGISEAMRSATCIWRSLAPDSDTLIRDGLSYLKSVERERYLPALAGGN